MDEYSIYARSWSSFPTTSPDIPAHGHTGPFTQSLTVCHLLARRSEPICK